MRRPYCDGPHAWEEHKHQGSIELQCSKCPATFPCRDSCAHTDCEAHTGRTATCPVCDKEVSFNDGFHFTSYSKLVRVCAATCVEAYESRRQEPETEPEQEKAA